MQRLLSDLRVWLVGDARLARAIGSLCAVERVDPESWRRPRGGPSPDLLLVQGAGEAPAPARLDELLAACEAAAVPRLLWITESPLDERWLAGAPRFDRVFTVDSEQLGRLEDAGARTPLPLWTATGLPVDAEPVGATASRPDPVVWVGGWRPDWPPAWRATLTEVLAGAARLGLRIVGVEDPALLPSELWAHLAADRHGTPLEQTLRDARVVIGADDSIGVGHVVPAVVFDAIACGAAVVSPHGPDAEASHARRDFVPLVRDRDSATAEIERLLADDALREQTVQRCRRVVAHNHTMAHRLATLASAAGYRVTPDAASRSALR